MSESSYERIDDAVWRTGPDRVVVRRVGDLRDDATCELHGGAALVWIALDEAGTQSDIVARLDDAGVTADVHEVVAVLLARGLLRELPAGARTP